MRNARLAVSLLIFLAVFLCAPGWGATYVISDFESDSDLAQWSGTDGASLSRVAAHATSGSYSCQADLPVTTYPGMYLSSFPTHDWSGYDVLRWEVYNPLSYAIKLHIEISDSVHGSGWYQRYYTETAVIPGLNHIEIDLHNVPMNDGSGDIDLTAVDRFTYYFDGFSSPITVYVDYVRLETVEDDPDADAARGIYKFDFGTADSPKWRDFYRVTASDTYSSSVGWGWIDTGDSRYSVDLSGPDDLCRDCVRPNPCCPTSQPLTFAIDVPDGEYTVYIIARSGDLHFMPVLSWEIWAEGVQEVNVPMDSATFFSTDYYYRGMDEDYPLSTSFWEKFEEPNFPAYKFTVTVSDGQLDLEVYRAWMFMLVVYPSNLESEMGPRIAGWEAARRAQFESHYYVNPPESLTFTPTPEETARGYAAWPVATMDPCHPDTLPPDPRPTLALSTAASQDERQSVALAIRPLDDLTDVSVEVSDLDDGAGHTIPSSEVKVRHVRYLATPDQEFFGPGVLTWKPRLLQDDFPIDVAGQVTKEFWLTVHVPPSTPTGTYTGTVTIHASSGDLAVPLSVEVWPFYLDAADDMSYGWYYMSPEERYCLENAYDYYWPEVAGWGDAILRQDFAFMKSHGFNALQFPSPGVSDIDPSTGHVGTLDFSELERYLSAMNDTGFGGDWMGQVDTIGIANAILRNSSVSEFDTNFDNAFKDVLSRIVAWENTDGAPLVIYLVDEPRETGIQPWNRNLADTLSYCDLAHQVPGVVSSVGVMQDTQDGLDYTPIADAVDIMQTHPWPLSEGLISSARSQGKPNWFYNTGGDLRMVYGFYQFAYGNGAWEWHYDWLDSGLFDSFPYSPFNDHWHYTYPSPNGPVATLKFEWASQGITDYRYAATLSRLSQQARATGLPEFVSWADQADALLDELRNDVPEYAIDASYNPQHFAGIPDGPGCLTQVENALESYRRRIAALIMALPGPIPGPEAQVTSSSLPTAMEWDTQANASLTVENLGSTTWTTSAGYQLLATSGVDRWGVLSQPLPGDVPPGASASFDFTVTAPPLTTISYQPPVTPTAAGATGDLACSWSLSHGADPLPGGTASEATVISRFPDVEPGTAGEWARFWVEECAGRVPLIVNGYPEPDGTFTYRPTNTVDRAAMAVYMARALKLPTAPYEARFPDVSPDHWAWPWIEALARAGVVAGYPDGTYRPSVVVDRDAMAVYVARGMRGGMDIPTGPATPTFPDVPTTYWAYNEIEYAVAHDVVHGYDDGTYRPGNPVTRDQMAVYVYRGFIAPTGAAVVLGGPDVTGVDPETAGYWGWSSRRTCLASSPGYAYVVFDAARLGAGLAGPDGFFNVTFTLTGPTAVSHTVSLSAADLVSAKANAVSTGVPYYAVSWALPAGLPAGDYTLTVSIEDETGATYRIARQPEITITP